MASSRSSSRRGKRTLEVSEESKVRCEKCNKLYATERTLWTHMVYYHCTTVPSMYKGRITKDLFFQKVDYDHKVVFLVDKRRLENKKKKYTPINDDAIGVEEAEKYQEGRLKKCGCISTCQTCDCCRQGQPCHQTCNCRCLAGDDEVVALFSGIPNCDLTPELQKIYARQYWQREGFDMAYTDYFRKHYGHLHYMMNCLPDRLYPLSWGLEEEEHDLYRNYAVLAIKRYNLDNDTEYKCVQLLAVNGIYGGEYLFFVTFVAVYHRIAVPQVFQAKLSFCYEGIHGERHVTRVLFCRLKPDN